MESRDGAPTTATTLIPNPLSTEHGTGCIPLQHVGVHPADTAMFESICEIASESSSADMDADLTVNREINLSTMDPVLTLDYHAMVGDRSADMFDIGRNPLGDFQVVQGLLNEA